MIIYKLVCIIVVDLINVIQLQRNMFLLLRSHRQKVGLLTATLA
jgi:hypothetical protein